MYLRKNSERMTKIRIVPISKSTVVAGRPNVVWRAILPVNNPPNNKALKTIPLGFNPPNHATAIPTNPNPVESDGIKTRLDQIYTIVYMCLNIFCISSFYI